MRKSKSGKTDAKRSVDEIVEWFDTTDTGDFLSNKPEVEFEIDLKRRRHLVELEPELVAGITKLARAKKLSSNSLVNSWVREKISETKRPRP